MPLLPWEGMMKKAFTLIELLVVVGLMGLMSTIAIGGYSAITRGMADRAALDAAKTILDAAVQRANLDRVRVKVFLFDEVLKLDSDMSAGVGAGVAIAVRPIGRISLKPEAGFFCDEFADLQHIYGALEEEGQDQTEQDREQSATTVRIYNLRTDDYVEVLEGVNEFKISDIDLEEEIRQEASEESSGGETMETMKEWKIYGFKKAKNGEGGATFEVGDQYGQEFAVTRLPPGYFFGQNAQMSSTTDLGQKKVSCLTILPTDRNPPLVTVYRRRPDGKFEDIGNIGQAKDGEK